VEVADVREALEKAGSFHTIFSDLTCPASLADCGLFTREWFQNLRAHLEPGGILAINGLSPDQTPEAYWCLYQTLPPAGLAALPDSPLSRAGRTSPASPNWGMATGGSSSARTGPSHPLRFVRFPSRRACELSTDPGSWTASSSPGSRPTGGRRSDPHPTRGGRSTSICSMRPRSCRGKPRRRLASSRSTTRSPRPPP